MITKETIFKDILGYEGLYQISNTGEVKSLYTNIIMKQKKNNRGYHQVKLFKDGKSKDYLVHRLVAEAFLENLNEDYNQVNHKDGNKSNNNVTNLEWCNQSQNIRHAFDNGLMKPRYGIIPSEETKRKMSESRKGHKAYYHKLVAQIDINTGEIIKIYNSTHDAAKAIGCHHTSISEVCRHKKNRTTTCNYKWEYIEDKK